MYSTAELIEGVQQQVLSTPVQKVERGNYFDIHDVPLEGLHIRIKPDSFGLFQVCFPHPHEPHYNEFNDYSLIDDYFKSKLKHPDASSFQVQVSSNKRIYIYPKYVYDLESCMRLLDYTMQEIRKAKTVIMKPAQQRKALGIGYLLAAASAVVVIGGLTMLRHKKAKV
jgi:hypothetical protein